MKTVSGSIFSKKGISLSKAARILSKFAFAENGASPAFAAYLKRASVSFDELVQFHREINGPVSEHKDRKNKHPSSSGVVNDETLIFVKRRSSKDNDFVTQEKQFSSGLKKLGNVDVKEDSESGERKKQNQGGERKGEHKDESQVVNDNISRKRKHKGDVSDGGLDNSEEQEQSKKRKK